MKMNRRLGIGKILLLMAIGAIGWNYAGWEKNAIAKSANHLQVDIADTIDIDRSSLEQLKLHQALVSQSSRPAKYKLYVRQLVGRVTYQPGGRSRRIAKIGDTLQNVGDRLITGNQSGAVLRLEETIAQVELAANSELVIRNFKIADRGGLVSQITLRQGRARFRVPDFLNPSSNMYVSTPTTQISLRGADFLVAVDADGKTTVSVWRGNVIAKGATALQQKITTGFYSLVFPGGAPTPPAAISNNIGVRIENVFMDQQRRTHVVAQVAPENNVFVASQAVITDNLGRFRVILPANSDRQFMVTVSSPLGSSQTYNLAVPVSLAN
ncbi:FecR family protein [Thalassoporum mexicanum PCC 7367]|uniref:FecR family protein n=1 Tax=Thalassoporum mexicanum TaxID=3457544 RepID=UPI00029FEA4C|nr:FecR family protein [Pseudanabaena sp. PCC 7367]AFY69765.1 FecR family protein [Pseudanabaena sp. PCC 7367]